MWDKALKELKLVLQNEVVFSGLDQPRPQGAFPWLWSWGKSPLGTRSALDACRIPEYSPAPSA